MSDEKENLVPALDNPINQSTNNITKASRTMMEKQPARIIRFGENENDVFLVKNDDAIRWALVDQLKEDPTSPEKWLALLKCPPSYEAKLYSKVRLFRRATTFISKESYRHNRSYAELWILFAKLKGTEKETRETFKYMKTERIGEREPMFYEEYAAFEHNLGNYLESEEVLLLGVQNGAYSMREKEEMAHRVMTGKLASYDTTSTMEYYPHVQVQTPRDQRHLSARSISTPNDSSTVSTMLATPVGYSHSSTASSAGFSSVSKLPRSNDGTQLLATPSMPIRAASKAQTTARKSQSSASRFYKLGGPPLRVIASTAPDDKKMSDGIDEDEDDDMTGEGPKNSHIQQKLSPVKESTQPTINTTIGEGSKHSIHKTDLSYIKNWAPRPIGSSSTSNGHGTSAHVHADTSRRPAENFGLGTTSIEPGERLPSPKRQQITPGVPRNRHGDNNSPLSVSSVSSSSSPPIAQTDGTGAVVTDHFASLTSKVVVKGLAYIKLEQIGSGGSSKVYRMLGPDLKIYALKRIKLKRLDAQSIEQYTNEIQLLQRLQGNPHIIRLIAAEQDLQQRTINVVMEHGEIDLSERLRDLKDGLDENFLRVIWTQMLQAVHAIHTERIIHGDLKPANFLFVNGALKLIDFGIAKAISNDTTNIERDSQVGTVNFMSPEAIQGNATPSGQRNPQGKMKVGRASDIWSLGCILYQIVYGKPPFADVHSIIEKFRCIIDPSYPIPFPPLKNKDLENVIRSCLQRDHRARPTIDGEGGLLSHAFLRSGGVNAIVSSDSVNVTLENAPQVLNRLGELLRAQGVDNHRVSTFLAIGQEGLRGRPSTPAYRYNTEERRTDI